MNNCTKEIELISVIVPVYNAQEYIAECIKSVIEQTYKNLEILIIDDGSTDNSLNICHNFNDERIKIYHNENKGLSFARQFGIDYSRGKYFVTIDADDWILPNYVESLYETIKKRDSDVAICNRYNFVGKKKYPCLKNGTLEILEPTKESVEENFFDYGMWCGLSDSWDKMYKTEFVKKSGVKFSLPKKYNGNDLLFNYKLLLNCPRFSFTNEILLMHRITKGSMVRTANKPILDGFEYIIEQIKIEVFKRRFSSKIFIELSKLYMLFLYLSVEYKAKYSKNIKKEMHYLYEKFLIFISKNSFFQPISFKSGLKYFEELCSAFANRDVKCIVSIGRRLKHRALLMIIFKRF